MIVNEASSFAQVLSFLLQLVTETKVKDSKPPLHGRPLARKEKDLNVRRWVLMDGSGGGYLSGSKIQKHHRYTAEHFIVITYRSVRVSKTVRRAERESRKRGEGGARSS